MNAMSRTALALTLALCLATGTSPVRSQQPGPQTPVAPPSGPSGPSGQKPPAQAPAQAPAQTPGQAPARSTSFNAPTIVNLLTIGVAGILTEVKTDMLREHFTVYFFGFALTADEKCDFLSQDDARHIESVLKKIKELSESDKPEAKKQGMMFLRSAASGLDDGKLFVARNACNAEASKKAFGNLAAVMKQVRG